jgi:hypothetical protein
MRNGLANAIAEAKAIDKVYQLANDGTAEFRVWWIPQVPGKPFEASVKSWADGKALEIVLANYDAFQFENNIKPDYCNTGGTQMKHAVLTEGEWADVDEHEAEEYGWSVPE